MRIPESLKEAFVIPIHRGGGAIKMTQATIDPFLFYRLFQKYLNGLNQTKCKTISINTI